MKHSKGPTHESKPTLSAAPDPLECPFREFKDNELSMEYWGMATRNSFRSVLPERSSRLHSWTIVMITTLGRLSAAAMRRAHVSPYSGGGKASPKVQSELKGSAVSVWTDDQVQPLPRSARRALTRWVRAEELATQWDCEVIVCDENSTKMSVIEFQLSHKDVLKRSSFCRRVMSACYVLERSEGMQVEHTWDSFSATLGPEGWRAKYLVYSPGTKPGGGAQHKPALSKNGCYLVRLYHMGSWRCVWVSDQVPLSSAGAPLLPFTPLLRAQPRANPRAQPALAPGHEIHLWPLLVTKALLKIAAPNMNEDVEIDGDVEEWLDTEHLMEDEPFSQFSPLQCLTGGMRISLKGPYFRERLWDILVSEVPNFSWDPEEDALASTTRSKGPKKSSAKELASTAHRRRSTVMLQLRDTKEIPPYVLPGIAPSLQMDMLVSMCRDVPLKKPLPEPEVPLWKTYRWVAWARNHGLYADYDCPRNRYLKITGLMKLSYAQHLLDVQSTESINILIKEEEKAGKMSKKEKDRLAAQHQQSVNGQAAQREELREWCAYEALQELFVELRILLYPSMFNICTAGSNPPVRLKAMPDRPPDVTAPKQEPLYLQIDSPEEITLYFAFSMLHPRILANCGMPIAEHIEKGHMVLEEFEWFKDKDLAMPKGFIETRRYDAVEIKFPPGRHFCRLWVHCRMNWFTTLLSKSEMVLGNRDVIQAATKRSCPWTQKYLNNFGSAFSGWIRGQSSMQLATRDKELFDSYQPDLEWDAEVVGYKKCFLHWMFRTSLQAYLYDKLIPTEFNSVCRVLRRLFMDPDFGHPPKPLPPQSLREVIERDLCDCTLLKEEELDEMGEEQQAEHQPEKEKIEVPSFIMGHLMRPTHVPTASRVCEFATADMPCGVLKKHREMVVRRHEAATRIQAAWRGYWARRCVKTRVDVTSDVLKLLSDNVSGNLDAQEAVMNTFFHMFPGAKYAYTIGAALSGVHGLHQHSGTSSMTPKCKWVPYFSGVFYCHAPVKVHFSLQSNMAHSTVTVYDNDTGDQMPQAYNSHITFNFHPNMSGYTVMGHGIQHVVPKPTIEVHWMLTVMSSLDEAFHLCDNLENEPCTPQPIQPSQKLWLEELYMPNRKHILAGIVVQVTKHESISFRATASSSDLEMVAILRETDPQGNVSEVGRCRGTGELVWPHIRLKPAPKASSKSMPQIKQKSGAHMSQSHGSMAGKKIKLSSRPGSSSTKRSTPKVATKEPKPPPSEMKTYTVEVVAPNGWPLLIDQWKRIVEIRNQSAREARKHKSEVMTGKKTSSSPSREKGKDAKGDNKTAQHQAHQTLAPFVVPDPQGGDAYLVVECATSVGGGCVAKRSDERELEFYNERLSWDTKDPLKRNLLGAKYREQFRKEHLEAPEPEKTEEAEEILQEEDQLKDEFMAIEISSSFVEEETEPEEELKYLEKPDQLKDKLIPLYFVPLCTKEKLDGPAVLETEDMFETAKTARYRGMDAALERMHQLQEHNEVQVLGRQKYRVQLLETVYVDSQFCNAINDAMVGKADAVAQELLERNLSLIKKKQEAKNAAVVKKETKAMKTAKPKGKN